MNNELELSEPTPVEAYIHYGEYDYDLKYPTLVIRSGGQVIGYQINPDNITDMKRTCICMAWYESECICGFKEGIDSE